RPQEGYLFPDTYFFLPNANADTVIETMSQNFNAQIASIAPPLASSTHAVSDIIKMASIVEKEARTDQDRKLIAGVLWRRIRLGMPLQSDVTFLYIGKNPSLLTTSDLKSDSPYNTYTHKGLPPTPIDSPSLASIEASAQPVDKGYLFYLADHSGVTHYCKTYACQLANERTYLGH
ncbi:MAG TPA: endolytic transglycosylase MltG, partial [Candidatus Paceibacterota bacterium]|nr:endolytic transglycosylase MltG [Candidatus Paceibacterota bacterium]